MIRPKLLVARTILTLAYGTLIAGALYVVGCVVYAFPILCGIVVLFATLPSVMRWAHRVNDAAR